MADWEKLRRILENLVNNAIKYTHRGGFVRLTIGFEDGETDSHSESEKADTNAPDGEDAAAGWIVMRVADDGMGIAPEELDQIFELYKQAGQSANRRYRARAGACRSARPHRAAWRHRDRGKPGEGGQHVHRAHSLCARH